MLREDAVDVPFSTCLREQYECNFRKVHLVDT
jgi:hypothetical protein